MNRELYRHTSLGLALREAIDELIKESEVENVK